MKEDLSAAGGDGRGWDFVGAALAAAVDDLAFDRLWGRPFTAVALQRRQKRAALFCHIDRGVRQCLPSGKFKGLATALTAAAEPSGYHFLKKPSQETKQ